MIRTYTDMGTKPAPLSENDIAWMACALADDWGLVVGVLPGHIASLPCHDHNFEPWSSRLDGRQAA